MTAPAATTSFDLLDRYGAARLAAVVGALALFLLLHLVRTPLLLAARALEVSMRRVDAYATRQGELVADSARRTSSTTRPAAS